MEVFRLCILFTVRFFQLLIQVSKPKIFFQWKGGKDLEEIELDHLDGHKGSRPVRIGNGAADHIQLVSLHSCGMDPLMTLGAGYLWRTVSFGADPFRSRLIRLSRMDCIYLGQKVMRCCPNDLELLIQLFSPVRETIGTLIVSNFFTEQLRTVSPMSQSYDDWYVPTSWSS